MTRVRTKGHLILSFSVTIHTCQGIASKAIQLVSIVPVYCNIMQVIQAPIIVIANSYPYSFPRDPEWSDGALDP